MVTGMDGTGEMAEPHVDTLDVDALSRFVREHTGAAAVHGATLERLSGGAIQENYRVRITLEGGSLPGEHVFVVRRDAPSHLPVSLTRPQEFAVLEVAHAAGVNVPRPFWSNTDASLSGGAFYLMQWVEGSASAVALTRQPFTPEQRRQLVFQLGREIAKLHVIRPPQPSLPFLPVPDVPPAQRRIDECRGLLDRMNEAQPALEHLLCWLEEHAPERQEYVLCHGDFRTGNYLVRDARLMALLDWEFAGWSDPYEDLGWMCARSWRFSGPQHEAGGIGTVADLFDGYATVIDHHLDLDRLTYWEVMASVRWAVIALLQAHRHLSGEEESLELLLTGYLAVDIQCDGLAHLRDADPALCASVGGDAPLPDISGFAQPSADAHLLHAARGVLMNDILPLLPDARKYDARMVAHAMSIAERGITEGAWSHMAAQAAITRFYAEARFPPPPRGAEIAGLARDIRQGSFTAHARQQLTSLVDYLLRMTLRVNNPKRLGRAS